MSKRISYLPRAISIKLILHRPFQLCAGCHRLLDGRIYILDIEKNSDRRTTQRLRAAMSHLWMLIRHHDDGIADLDFRMAHLSTRIRHAHYFRCVEYFLIEINGSRCTVDDQVGGHRVIALGNWID